MVSLDRIKWRKVSEEEFDRVRKSFGNRHELYFWTFTYKVIYHLQNSKFAILRYDTDYNRREGDWQDFYVAEQYYTIMDILKGDTNMLCVLGPMLMNVEG